MTENRPDPNEGRNDPMVAEYWRLGEDLQDAILAAGYRAESVEGIAVDIHDLLQATERIQNELIPAVLGSTPDQLAARLQELSAEFDHIRWHCNAAEAFLAQAQTQLADA